MQCEYEWTSFTIRALLRLFKGTKNYKDLYTSLNYVHRLLSTGPNDGSSLRGLTYNTMKISFKKATDYESIAFSYIDFALLSLELYTT